MMPQYQDATGVVCEAFQLVGPTVLGTATGEQCGAAGDWAVYVEGNAGRPVIVSDAVFAASFSLLES